MSDNGGYYDWSNGAQDPTGPPTDMYGESKFGNNPEFGGSPQVDPYQSDPYESQKKKDKDFQFEPEPENDKKLTFKGTMVDFAENTTLHGVPRLVISEHIWPYVWAVVVTVVTSIFLWLFSSLIVKFFEYPINVTNKVIYKEVEFPAISICNMNNLRRSAVENDANILLAMDAFEANIQSQLQGDLEDPSLTRRKRDALHGRKNRRKRGTCGLLGCPPPNSQIGFWPFSKKYDGYDRSGWDNKAYISPSVTYIDGPTNLTDGAAWLDGHLYSFIEIQNNGALDVQNSFTWMGWVMINDTFRDSPLFVWLPNPEGHKSYASGLVARMKDGIMTYHMSLVEKQKDIAGVYAMEAKLKPDTWHLLAVGYDAHNGVLQFKVDDDYEIKNHMLWINQTHDTATNIRIGSYEPGGPNYLSQSAMKGAISCVQLFNYFINLTLLENLVDVLPCECVNNSCAEPPTTTTTTTMAPVNFTTQPIPDGNVPLVDLSDDYFVPDVEEKPWYDPGTPSAAVENAANFSRLLRTLDLPIRRDMGHHLDTLLQQCTYDTSVCTPLNFTGFTNGKYGNCYTFNGATQDEFRNASQPGSLFGLVLTLYIEQHEYISALSSAAGVRVLVHLQGEQPFPEDGEGIDVMPGRKTSIAVKKRDYLRLGDKYSDCTDGSEVELMYSPDIAYSDGACRRSCQQRQTIEDCGCGVASLPVPEGTEVCLDDDDVQCTKDVFAKYETGEYECSCPEICRESMFLTSVSTSEWPGLEFEEIIRNEYIKRDPSIEKVLQEKDGISANFLKLEVHYDDIMYEVVEETAAYPSSSLLADIGGQLGLWLGLSILTLVEIVQLAVDLATLCCRKKTRRVRPK